MAWTASKGMQASECLIKVVKGNGLDSRVTESFDANMFQSSLADGLDRNKAVRVTRQIAALGTSGDYILLEIPYTLTTGTADTRGKNSIYIDARDYSNVNPLVQEAVFGAFRPFATGRPRYTVGEVKSIDQQTVALSNNVGMPAVDGTGTTAVEQTVRGSTDPRITCYYSADDPTAAAGTAYMKIKPNSDGVFVIPAGAKIWIDNSDDGMGETGA